MLQTFSTVAGDIQRPHRNVHRLLPAFIEPRDDALRPGINDVGIGRIRRNVTALAASDFIPILAADHAVIVIALDGDRGIILLRAVDVVRPTIVGNHVVELCRGLVVLCRPSRAAVDRDGCSTIIPVD